MNLLELGRKILRPETLPIKDYRSTTKNPVHGYYLSGGRPFLILASLDMCRSWLGFPLNDIHPFVRTVKQFVDGKTSCFAESPLKEYYDHFHPRSPFEALGLVEADGDRSQQYPPYSFVYPWQRIGFAEREDMKRRIANIENAKRGRDLPIEKGIGAFGPTSEEKGEVEFNALQTLTKSIREKGYRRDSSSDGDIKATVAISGDDYRFFIESGFHRSAVLAALGLSAIPLRISVASFVREDEVHHWPQVQNGTFELVAAQTLFAKMFAGDPPQGAVPHCWR